MMLYFDKNGESISVQELFRRDLGGYYTPEVEDFRSWGKLELSAFLKQEGKEFPVIREFLEKYPSPKGCEFWKAFKRLLGKKVTVIEE